MSWNNIIPASLLAASVKRYNEHWGPNGFMPWRHQVDGLALLRQNARYCLFDDVGCGKTAPLAVRIVELVKAAKTPLRKVKGLVLAEKSLIYQWPGDIQQVAPGLSVGYVTGEMTPKQKRMFWASPPDIICMNYQYVKSCEKQLQALVDAKLLVCCVLDEQHNLAGYRGPRSKQGTQAKRVIRLIKDVPHVYGATASALANPDSPRIWGILRPINPKLLSPTVSMFERIFYDNFSPSYKYKQLKLKPAMVDELGRVIRTVSRRVVLKDTGAEVPDRIIHDIYVPMSPKLRKAYRSLKDMSLMDVDERTVSRPDILSRNMALLQVASGWVIDSPDPLEIMARHVQGEEIPEKMVLKIDSSHKDAALAAILEELGDEKVIVWAHFTHELAHLEQFIQDFKTRGGRISRVDGKTGNRAENIAAFKATGRHSNNTFLGQSGACGAGLNLQVAQHMVRYSRSHFTVQHEQSLGRNLRAVRDQLFKKINYFSIMTDATVDVRTEMRNRGKKEFSGMILLDHLSYEERQLA